jgi:hypothetical protein
MTASKSSAEAEIFDKRTNYDEMISGMVRMLTGVEFKHDKNGNLVPKINKEQQIMNVEGAKIMFNFLQSRVNRVSSLTKLEDDEISNHVRNGVFEFQKIYAKNYKKYDLDKELIWSLVDSFRSIYHFQLKKAADGWENQQISQQSQKINYRISDDRKNSGYSLPMPGKKAADE